MSREDIVAAARALIGTPFAHQGRRPRIALDCAGLVVAVADEIGIRVLDQQGYGRRPSNGMLQSAIDGQPCLLRISPVEIQAGDVLLMRVVRDPQHLAIALGDGRMLHAIKPGGVCEVTISPLWQMRLVARYGWA